VNSEGDITAGNTGFRRDEQYLGVPGTQFGIRASLARVSTEASKSERGTRSVAGAVP